MKPVGRGWTWLVAVAAACALISCSALKPVPPEVSLTGLSVEGLTLNQADLNARLRIFNPNRVALTIQQIDYTLLLDGIKVSDGRSLVPARIGAHEYGYLDMKLSASYLPLWQVLTGLADKEDVRFAMAGSVRISGWGGVGATFPLKREGTASLRQLWPGAERKGQNTFSSSSSRFSPSSFWIFPIGWVTSTTPR
ncbi:MAG: LEA type 2 family protein [Desulfobacteraceae bacterium]|nr:LEA type 2 family protein [Desulfobacteraceae bacterium]